MPPKKNSANKPILKPARVNPAVYPNSSSSTDIHTHPSNTRNNQVKTIFVDSKPYTTVEAHLGDAKFYLEGIL
ncbi:Uncharacterized protein TCM_002070 [Theobroma cacao]|uniref:Uncharacterized protein n=1 Tax=Theobroma cacao TaxID=3641 RepID=A0A061DTE7_THECC|nr:Uncharacterized protein TCM_002070 [Theobroma cacao]